MDALNRINDAYINACPDNTNGRTYENKIQPLDSCMFLRPVAEEDVADIIRGLNNTRSVGEDELSVVFYKYMCDLIKTPLTYVINLSFQTAVFPNLLKRTIIKPIYKKGDKSVAANYRPIALLTISSKIFEKSVLEQLISYVNSNGILLGNQHGFLKSKSTQTAMVEYMEYILKSLNSRNHTAGIHIDLTKAFDCVDYTILISKLEAYGIRGTPLKLLEDYLTNRQQRVVAVTDEQLVISSDWMTVKRGVPQGSILGPYLFILYINDLPATAVSVPMTMYADDTSVVLGARGQPELEMDAALTLSSMEDWFRSNSLRLNASKTSVVYYSTNPNKEQLRIVHGDTVITSMSSTSFLGVVVDERLDWRSHIDYLAAKISTFAFVLRTLHDEISREVALQTYYAHVNSRMSYGVILWGNSSEAERIFILQKRCIRNIFSVSSTTSCRPLFKLYKIPTLTELYIVQCCLHIHRKRDSILADQHRHNYNTRQDENYIQQPYTHLTTIQKQFETQAIRIYNYLPASVKHLSMRQFKRKMSKLKGKCIYSLDEFFNYGCENLLV